MIGLLVLVLIGWFVKGAVAGEAGSGSMRPSGDSARVSATVWTVEQDLPEQNSQPNFRQTDADAG